MKADMKYGYMWLSTLLSALLSALLCAILTFIFLRYKMVDLEESYIFLWDWDYVSATVSQPGGFAGLLASFLTQFMLQPLVGTLISFVVYWGICYALCRVGVGLGMPSVSGVLSALPCLLLMLCLENNAYCFRGHTAMLIVVWLLYAYSALKSAVTWRVAAGIAITMLTYWLAGSMAIVTAVCCPLYDALTHRRKWWLGVLYPLAWYIAALWCFRSGLLPTDRAAFTPGAYYLWNGTAYMMLYAWIAVPVFMFAAWLIGAVANHRSSVWIAILTVMLLLGEIGTWSTFYTAVHSESIYRLMQQRYYAKHGDWDSIIDLDYPDEPTPYTSYRNLALAQKGQMVRQLEATHSFISYYMQNKTLVKKEDQQVLSDIYYHCGFMAGARHSAFDTDIVTPGAFNPVETLKLAEINLLYGDYAVADKLLTQLEKTLFYKDKARRLRRFLYDDEAIAADPDLSRKRRLIPMENNYTSPKGMLRDLSFIVRTDSTFIVADQFYQAYKILNHIDHE